MSISLMCNFCGGSMLPDDETYCTRCYADLEIKIQELEQEIKDLKSGENRNEKNI